MLVAENRFTVSIDLVTDPLNKHWMLLADFDSRGAFSLARADSLSNSSRVLFRLWYRFANSMKGRRGGFGYLGKVGGGLRFSTTTCAVVFEVV